MQSSTIKKEFILLPKSKIKAGAGVENGKYPFFTSSDIKVSYLNSFEYNEEALIIGTGGKASCNYINGKFSFSTDNYALKARSNIETKFLYYFLRKDNLSILQNGFHGAGLQHISKDYILDIKVSLYEKKKQLYIINCLDSINKLITILQKQLILFNELIKSRFIEMFGDIKSYVAVADSCEVHARIGWQALTQKEHMQSGKYMLITGTDFIGNEINYSTCVFVSKERYDMDNNIILKNNDVLITKDGTIGKVAIVHNLPGPATLNSGVFVVRPDNRFNKEYISYVFKGEPFSRFVEEVKTGVTVKHLNQAALLKFKIPVPSIKQQNEFASFLNQIDKLKFIVQEQINNLQELFDKKMDEYFGE